MGTRIFDACAYLGPWPYSGYGIRNAEELVAEMDRQGISAVALSSTAGVFAEVDRANREVREAVQRFPQRFRPVYVTTPTHRSASMETLSSWASEGCCGVRLWPQHHGYKLTDPFAQRLLGRIEKAEIPVFLSVRVTANWGLPVLSLDEVAAAAPAQKNLKIVLGGFNYDEFLRAVDLAKGNGNILLEISCLQMRDPLEALVQSVDASRVLLGTAMPLQYARCSLVKVQEAALSEEEKTAVNFGNAQRLFRLSVE